MNVPPLPNVSDDLLHAGVGRAIITPPVGFEIAGPEFPDRAARRIDDDLYLRCIVLQSADTTVAIVSLDIWALAAPWRARIRRAVAAAANLPQRHVVVTTTGNGTSPPLWRSGAATLPRYRNYIRYLPDVAAGTAAEAAHAMRPAAIGTVSAKLPNLNCFAEQGQPEPLEAERETLTVSAIRDADDATLAIVCSFACPATIIGAGSDGWAADYPGVAMSALEQAGVGAAVFLQGASEDIRPFDWWDGNPNVTHAGRTFGDALALGILLATQTMRAASNALARRNADIDVAISTDVAEFTVGDAKLIAVSGTRRAEFAAELRAGNPESKLLISTNAAPGGDG